MGFIYTPAIPAAGTFVGAWEFSPDHLASYSALATYDTGSPVLVDSAHPLPIAGAITVSSLPAITFAAPQNVIVDSGSVTITNPTDVSALATSAKQDTGNTALGNILSGLGALATHALQTAGNALLGAGLPAALGTAGGLKASLVDLGGAATDVVLQAVRDRLPAALVGGRLSVDVGASALPAGAALETGGNLAAILARLPAAFGAGGGVKVDGSGTPLPASLASLPALATGTATIGAVTAPGAAALALDATLTGGTQIAKIAPSATTVYGGSGTWPTAGQQIGSGALRLLYVEIYNGTGSSIYLHVFDRTSAPSNGDRPAWPFSALISSGATQPIAVGHSVYGFSCANGAWVAFSSTLTTYTAIASTAVVVFNAIYST